MHSMVNRPDSIHRIQWAIRFVPVFGMITDGNVHDGTVARQPFLTPGNHIINDQWVSGHGLFEEEIVAIVCVPMRLKGSAFGEMVRWGGPSQHRSIFNVQRIRRSG